MDPELSAELGKLAKVVDEALDSLLPPENSPPGRLAEAMRYSVFAGGKRLRPALVLLVARALGAGGRGALDAACAVEMVHTYSLIHDDLPAMDDDDLRRGKPSSHKAFGEAMAILAGDALLTLAFEVAAGSPKEADPARLVRELAAGAGAAGMVAGQVADVEAEKSSGGIEEVDYIHRHKTAALMRAGARMGAVAAGAAEPQIELAGRFGEKLGMLFQVRDDLLDVTAETKRLGKTVGKDAAAGKLTYPAVLGLAGAQEAAETLAGEALTVLEQVAPSNRILAELVYYVLNRSY